MCLRENITGVHLETKQRHWYILRSVKFLSVETAQIYILVWDYRLNPCLWNRGLESYNNTRDNLKMCSDLTFMEK